MGASFAELEVWKAGCRLAVAGLQEMRTCTLHGLRDQMVKSVLSIPSNIAEGSERRTTKDFSHFLHIALGSAAELRTQTYIARETEIVAAKIAEQWITELKSISKMLQALINSINNRQP